MKTRKIVEEEPIRFKVYALHNLAEEVWHGLPEPLQADFNLEVVQPLEALIRSLEEASDTAKED